MRGRFQKFRWRSPAWLTAIVLCFAVMPGVNGEPVAQMEAKKVFGSVQGPIGEQPAAIGSYSLGCMSGAKQLPADGTGWQTMRPSRNRAWGQPSLIKYIEKLAHDASQFDGITGLLVGDMAQPAGGPMLGGHASHQIGLDADIWFKSMPKQKLSPQERDTISADDMVDEDKLAVSPEMFGDAQIKLLRRAASYPEVARIFVNPAIKKAICEGAKGDRAWLAKVRPWWQHNYHFHVRLSCPKDQTGCVNQIPAGADDGCGEELEAWFKKLKAAKTAPKRPPVAAKPLLVSALPKDCQTLAVSAAADGKAQHVAGH